MEPLQVLLDDDRPAGGLPATLASLYGGGLALGPDLVYASVVTSLDGVAGLEARRGSSAALRGDCDADRFVVALLRSLADAVLIGAGTLRAYPRHRWTAAGVDRERAADYRALGRPEPRLVVATVAGRLDPAHPALASGALVLTTDAGEAELRGRLRAGARVLSLGPRPPSGPALLAAIRAEGRRRVLVEGGPTLLGHLVAVLDELFLTFSPVLAGRRAGDGRLGPLEGVHLLPDRGRWARLRSLRRSGSHLFARYSLIRPASA